MQKRVLCIHDLAGIGRCSLAVALPVLSALGHNVCSLPTALLSTHTGGFGVPTVISQTEFCLNALKHYKALNESFDCVYSGYITDAIQAQLIDTAVSQSKSTVFVLDPVMGDNGRLYSGLSDNIICVMKKLAKKASVLLPNVTESALLAGDEPSAIINNERDIAKRLNKLSQICSGAIVITGVRLESGQHVNVCLDKSGKIELLQYKTIDGAYPGTGDLFASVLTGCILNAKSLTEAVKFAAEFTAECVNAANQAASNVRYGVPFEPLLYKLFTK